jgi:hypothetical protein
LSVPLRTAPPITLRDEGIAIHRENVDVPEIVFAGSVDVVTAIPPEPCVAGDIGEKLSSRKTPAKLL